jgi:hypothetical protein
MVERNLQETYLLFYLLFCITESLKDAENNSRVSILEYLINCIMLIIYKCSN